ncbi:hypothetical protein JXM67_08315 [candidate division WOR-3 bacterium]|nr:hypothetical protein [candidate division WOR-3 bacterium]
MRRFFVFLGVVSVIILSLTPTNLRAGWLKYYGIADTSEMGYCLLHTADAGFIMSAYAVQMGKMWVIKTDSEGDVQWNSYYTADFPSTNKNCIRKTADGGYILTGSGFKLLKIGSSGDSSWAYQIEDHYYTQWAEQTSDGGYIAIGHRDTTFGAEGYATRIWLFKTDASGAVQWEKTYGIHESDSLYFGFCIQEASDGNYIACGSWMYKVWLAKIDQAGDTMWSKTFPEPGYGAYSLRETSDGGIIMCGYASPSVGLLVVKTDASGVVEWSTTYGGESFSAQDIRETPDGGYVLTGIRDINPYKLDVVVQRLSSAGDIQWTKIYGDTLNNELGRSIELTSDGGYAIGGSIYWDNPGPGHQHDHYDVLLLKLDESGDTMPTSISEVEPAREPGFEILTSTGSKVHLSSLRDERLQLKIFDASGRLVDELALDGHSKATWGNGFLPGIYFIKGISLNQVPCKVILIK